VTPVYMCKHMPLHRGEPRELMTVDMEC